MGGLSKTCALFLILIIALSCLTLLTVKPANAQTIPKPSVPEFTVQEIENNYEINIFNQPIIPNGHDTAGIFYNIRIKSHSTENWVSTTVPNPSQGIRGYIGEIGQSGYTTLANDFNSIRLLLNLSSESQQIDFQVEAINGYLNTTPASVPPIGFDPNSTPVIIVNTSGWSNSQTITIPTSPASSTIPTSTSSSIATTTPTGQANNQVGTDFLLYIIIVLVAVVIALLLTILVIMQRKNKN